MLLPFNFLLSELNEPGKYSLSKSYRKSLLISTAVCNYKVQYNTE